MRISRTGVNESMTNGIERIVAPLRREDASGLALLLIDAVESGAAVSFMLPLTRERAEEWWRGAIASARPGAVFLVARDDEGIAGTVQLHPAWAPNQPHRADVAKLLVHRRARGRGLGARLMAAVEKAADEAGLLLLTLDAKRGGDAERLYRRLGWVCAGVIPDYALDPDGAGMHDTVIFYKRVSGPGASIPSTLDHADPAVAEAIRELMVESYRVEAEILGVTDFVPLRRTAAQIASAPAVFLGVTIEGELAAAAEIETAGPGHVHIGSMVVRPARFRRGLATRLLEEIFRMHGEGEITVSTGLANEPALRLYEGSGFRELRRWSTPDGIPMITLRRAPRGAAGG